MRYAKSSAYFGPMIPHFSPCPARTLSSSVNAIYTSVVAHFGPYHTHFGPKIWKWVWTEVDWYRSGYTEHLYIVNLPACVAVFRCNSQRAIAWETAVAVRTNALWYIGLQTSAKSSRWVDLQCNTPAGWWLHCYNAPDIFTVTVKADFFTQKNNTISTEIERKLG